VAILQTGEYQKRAAELGEYLFGRLRAIESTKIREIRGRGLWVGIELYPEAGTGKQYCMELLERGMLCKDTHVHAIRLAPPLCISKDDIDHAVDLLAEVLA